MVMKIKRSAPKLDYSLLMKRQIMVQSHGLRLARVIRVYAGVRVGLTAVRVESPSYEGRDESGDRWGWNGPKRKVLATDIQGVYFRRRTIPLVEFVMSQMKR